MRGVFHTGITIPSPKKALQFYHDVSVLKIAVGPTGPVEGEDLANAIGVPRGPYTSTRDDYLAGFPAQRLCTLDAHPRTGCRAS